MLYVYYERKKRRPVPEQRTKEVDRMLVMIVNPVSGRGYAAKIGEKALAVLKSRGLECEYHVTTRAGEAARLAREAAQNPRCEAVLSVGGDGMASEVASGLVGTGKPMGILPAGTGNDLIKTLGLPREPMAALEFVLTHKPRPLDAARINGRWFVNVCGLGFDVTVLDEAYALQTRLRGLLPYLYGVIRAIFRYQPVHVRYEVDGRHEERDVLLLSAANGRFIGGGIPICPAAEPTDGLLDVVMVDTVPRWKIPFYLPGLMQGKVLGFGISHHERCRNLHICANNMRVQVDGEILSMDEARIDIQPGQLMLYW